MKFFSVATYDEKFDKKFDDSCKHTWRCTINLLIRIYGYRKLQLIFLIIIYLTFYIIILIKI